MLLRLEHLKVIKVNAGLKIILELKILNYDDLQH